MPRMAATVTLRPARARDARAIALMSRDRIEAGLSWRYTPARIAALIAEPEVAVVAACGEAGLLGFSVMQFGDDRAHLVLLAVDRAVQRRGIGRRLVQWQLDSVRVAGIARITLELRADNEAGYSFYRHLGFEPTGRIADYYDGVVAARCMQLDLRA